VDATPTTTGKGSASSTAPASLDSQNRAQVTGGLSDSGRTAIAVVVPIVVVALLILAGIFIWRKRKQRKDAEELRRKEVEEYGYNPNNDRTLAAGIAASDTADGPSEMREGDGAGYRGWGTTTAVGSTAHKTSTTMSSANGPIAVARSDSDSQPGAYHSAGQHVSDGNPNDPPVSPINSRPDSGESPGLRALGGAPASMSNRQAPKRGPSNASSAYSAGNRSDVSAEGPITSPQYYNDGLYHDEAHGPYDNSWGGAQPIIRDVSAKRNTRIENPSVFPQQGNAGIAQNF